MARLILITILLFLCNNIILGQSKPKRDSSKDFRTEVKNRNKNVTSTPNKSKYKQTKKKKNQNPSHRQVQQESWFNEDDVFHDASYVGTIEAYEDYLKYYPNGKYVNQAKKAIQELQLTAKKAEESLSKRDELYNKGLSFYDCKDYQQAVYYFKLAAEQGHAEAQHYLGACYGEGLGVELDYQQAIYWIKKAVGQGMTDAHGDLGIMYYAVEDYQQAVYWLKKAKDDDGNAQLLLGACYFEGKGVEQDYQQSFYWIKKAAKSGNDIAKDILSKAGVDY